MKPVPAAGPVLPRIPVWLKIGFTAFVVFWVPVYWPTLGPENFLWFCDLANFLIVAALWAESPLLFSTQAVSTLLVQMLWIVDVSCRVVLGFHPIGGTEYMFNAELPLVVRLFSLFHAVTPVLLIWALWRLGYDRRGWLVQTGLCWVILPASFLLTEPQRDINWVWGLFGKPQGAVHPTLFFAVMMVGYPVVLYLPSHILLRVLFRRSV